MTEKEIIVHEIDNDYPYSDGPLPEAIRVHESGHNTSADIKVNAANYGNHGYSIQIEQGVSTSDGEMKARVKEFGFMNMEEVHRLVRLLSSTADYIEKNWEND